MTPHMRKYLLDYLDFATRSHRKGECRYYTHYALCGNISYWIAHMEKIVGGNLYIRQADMRQELQYMLKASGLDDYFPFNQPTEYPFTRAETLYEEESRKRAHHKNELRLEWIRQQLRGE